MNIRKFCRLGYLTVASLFWASCSESNPQIPTPLDPASNTSSDVSSSGEELSSSAEESSPSSSSSEDPVMSSAEIESSSEASSSSDVASSSSAQSSSSSGGGGAPLRDYFEFTQSEETTGILQTEAVETEDYGTVYDLMGRPVTNPAPGIYIVNGKKVFIK